jgi:PPK2 family polyphosphate:nucleotide phosphotransferase
MATIKPARIARFIEPFRVPPGAHVRLPRDYDPTRGLGRTQAAEAKALLQSGIELLADYQDRLAAQDTYGLLVVLQAMDAAGKDGTIRHVMSGVNPQGVSVHSFKIPSAEDLDHDFLWRYQKVAPQRGSIAIFNRSHYEEVLVVRVHPDLLERQKLPRSAIGKSIWEHRYRSINDWERHLVENGIRVVKLFLNVSEEEQRRRFLARIDEPRKNWKFSVNDARERTFWNKYQRAFAEMLGATSTDHAPWYVIPADDKRFARVAAAGIIANALIEIDPHYPKVGKQQLASLQTARVELAGDGGNGRHDGAERDVAQAGDGSQPGGGKHPAAAATGRHHKGAG